MEQVTTLRPSERVRLDAEQLELLYSKLGEESADEVLCRAMEEMAIRLKQSERQFSSGNTCDLRKTVHSLIAIAEQVGLMTLARVSADVVNCIDRGDWIALGSTFDRLVRCGDRSLTAIWDLQDVTV